MVIVPARKQGEPSSDVKLRLTVFSDRPGFGFFIPTGFQPLALGRGFRAPRELSKFPPALKGNAVNDFLIGVYFVYFV